MAAKKEKGSESVQDRNTIANGVVIKVYVESVTTRTRKLSEEPNKKTKPHAYFRRPITAGTHGYDRRAMLLDHSRQLRKSGSVKVVQLPTNQSRPKTKSEKGVLLTPRGRICMCSLSSTEMFPSSSSRCRNEQVASKESKESNQSKKRKSSVKIYPPFLSTMKNMVKQLSCKEI